MESNNPISSSSTAVSNLSQVVKPVKRIPNLFSKRLIAIIVPILIISAAASSFLILRQKNSIQLISNRNFELVESSPEDQENSFSAIGQPTFVFSKKIGVKETDLKKYFHITPQPQGNWHLEKNGQVVYFSTDKTQENSLPNTLENNTVYSVTIDKTLPSVDSKNLNEDINLVFRTNQNPSFGLVSEKKLISATPTTVLPINIRLGDASEIAGLQLDTSQGSTPLEVSVRSATENQLLSYFKYKEGKFPLYQFIPDSSSQQIATTQAQLQSSADNQRAYQIKLASEVFLNPGIYFVTVKNLQGSEDFFVTISNHITQIFNDSGSNYLWVTDQKGQGIGGVTAELIGARDSTKVFDKAITDSDGLGMSQKSPELVDFVITKISNDIAVTFTKQYGKFFNMDDRLNVFSYTDRPVYRPGDTVHYKSVIRKKENGSYIVPSTKYYLQFSLDSLTNDKKYQEVTPDQNGTVIFDFKLPLSATENFPSIILHSKLDDGNYKQINSLPVVVQAYRKPDLDISATTLEKEYISSDSAHMNIFAKTNFGQPLANIGFSYRVLVNNYQEVKDRSTENLEFLAAINYGGGDSLLEGKGQFDAKGVAHINFDTRLANTYEFSQWATLEITPEIGASPSIGRIAKLIHRGEFALFINDLNGDLTKGIKGNVSVLDHQDLRGPVIQQAIKVNLYKADSNINKQILQTQDIRSGIDGSAQFAFLNLEQGSYEVVAQSLDKRGNIVTARSNVFISGKQNIPNKPQFNITINSDKQSYAINNTANVGVTADFVMQDVVVVLTNNSGNTASIISLTKNHVGANSWNLPLLLKESFGDQVGIDVFAVNQGLVIRGYLNIQINRPERKINTTISFDKKIYQPGEIVKAVISNKDSQGNAISADNSLSLVDASLLQIGRLNGDIYSTFYGYTPTSAVSHFDSTTGIFSELQGGGGGCFVAGTKILMSDGSLKNIEDVLIGDKILTRSSDYSGEIVEDTVTQTHEHSVTDYLTINDKLNVTWIHRIYINNSWQEAKAAKIGDTLLDENGIQVKINSIVPHLGQFRVYNLTTSHYHTFFADGFYVHNDKGPEPRQNFADTAYWNPHIQTGNDGLAQVSFKLPDNVTTFTAQVFSNTRDSKFGQGISEFIVQKDFNIVPVVSKFYYQGDQPIVSALLQNSSGQDVNVEISLVIGELDFNKKQSVQIPKGGIEFTSFPIDISSSVSSITLIIEAKNNGTTLDSVQVKSDVLPKGDINSTWTSFSGSKDLSFKSSYPMLDFNTLTINVIPNVVTNLFQNNVYFTNSPAIREGKNIYAYSYILAQTREGNISPSAYKYANISNQFRNSVNSFLLNKKSDIWYFTYNSDESLAAMNLWLSQGIYRASSLNLLNGLSNANAIVTSVQQFFKKSEFVPYPPANNKLLADINQEEELFVRQWVLKQQIDNQQYKDSNAYLAAAGLNSSPTELAELRSTALESADDRYIWDGVSDVSTVLPTLAIIENSDHQDADKAIKGLSYTSYRNGVVSPLAVLAGAEYAVKEKLYVDSPQVSISINGEPVYETTDSQRFIAFNQRFQFKDAKNGELNFHLLANGQVPIYTTIVQSNYGILESSIATISLMDQLKGRFVKENNNQFSAKVLDLNLTRGFKDVGSGQDISQIPQGKSGIVVLTMDNPITKSMYNLFNSHFVSEDAISPSFMYLNQESGNSPQFQSILDRFFPPPGTYQHSYMLPTYYSDQAVFYNSRLSVNQSKLVFPYVVYNISGGSYYQPKTDFVFDLLGIITKEH